MPSEDQRSEQRRAPRVPEPQSPGQTIALTTTRGVTRKPNPTTGKAPKRPKAALTKRVRGAIDAQIFEGLGRADAAKKAGMAEISFYQALRKPVVLAYFNAQLEVLRTGERPRNIARLAEIRDQNANLGAAVRAVQLLEPARSNGPQVAVGVNVSVTAGYVIDLSPDPVTIDQRITEPLPDDDNPLMDNDDVGG